MISWIVFILPGLVLAADPQQRTVSFPANNNGMSPQQQQNIVPNGNQNPISMAESYPNNPNMGYYRNMELPPNVGPGSGALYPPEVPNFYFNAGFNKGLGFRFPDALTGANYLGAGQHSPLGDLWATKADLLPAIFKTGFFVTAILVIVKIIIFLIQAKYNFLVSGPLAGVAGPAPVVISAPVPVGSFERGSGTKEEKRNKREASGSPVVDPATDFDQILEQLESIRSRFDHQN